jgi:uncharacterized protein
MNQNYGVRHVGLFGSYARQAARDDSDVDLVVEFEADKKTLRNFFSFKRYLEKGFGRTVDLGMESALKPIELPGLLSAVETILSGRPVDGRRNSPCA